MKVFAKLFKLPHIEDLNYNMRLADSSVCNCKFMKEIVPFPISYCH